METLNQLGLNNSEIKVYFALLELESSTVGRIIGKAKVQDSKIYSILEKLIEKGLASFVIKNNVKHFQASDPKNLLKLIDEKKRAIDEQRKELEENVIPQIEEKRKAREEKQEARVYEGLEGLKSAFNYILDTLSKGEEYYAFLLGEELGDGRVIRFFNNYHNKRVQKQIRVKFISTPKNKKIVENNYNYKFIETRYSDRKFPIGTIIFMGHILTIIWGEKPTAFIIKSKRNYEYYRQFFEEIWKLAKK